MKKRLTEQQYVDQVNLIHDNKYEYPTLLSKSKYIRVADKIKIVCPDHGVFYQRANSHKDDKHKCPYCGGGIKYSVGEFIRQAKIKHGNKFNYSNITEYINENTPLSIICPNHGEIKITGNNHLSSKYGCNQCWEQNKSAALSMTLNVFTQRSQHIHNNKYDYSKVVYTNAHTNVCIICQEHGEFWQKPWNHLNECGCPKCKSTTGEEKVRILLDNHYIDNTSEYRFDDCRDILPLPFDFYLPKHNILIEYDGIQHYESIKFFGGDKGLRETQRRDAIKNKYCKDNNIQLIRIKYDESIEDKLNSIL